MQVSQDQFVLVPISSSVTGDRKAQRQGHNEVVGLGLAWAGRLGEAQPHPAHGFDGAGCSQPQGIPSSPSHFIMTVPNIVQSVPAPAAPQVKSFDDLDGLYESLDPETGETRYTTFYVIDNQDNVFFGQVLKERKLITPEEFTDALRLVPDEDIYPKVPPGVELTISTDTTIHRDNDAFYVKRPQMSSYDDAAEDREFMPKLLLDEALIMERITSGGPHPNIVPYYGCRVHRGRVTGIVLKGYTLNLHEHLLRRGPLVPTDRFMEALESAVRHLHSLGLAHNDINPRNIMIERKDGGIPILIDFGSCQPFGKPLVTLGTEGWVDEIFFTSEKEHDLVALEKIREWLVNPTFD
ncbi:kinase-like domain-containing protein [Podospora didyma]|uniref:Kinase-like domain-containing protein n=1 Tax=Podospora didyma TaxID=330526 RepID=A0AAE0TZP9_9PEZI|nr:kinase-like domain-containing protein [Podospora didyma]